MRDTERPFVLCLVFLYFDPNILTNFQNPLDIFLNLYYNKSVMQTQ